MTDKTQPTGAGVPAAQLDAILLAMHLRQRAKLTATGNADALSQNAANVLVAQYDRIAELKAEGSRLQNGLEAQRMLTDRAISVAKDLDAQAAAKCLHQGADAGAVAALKGLLSLVRREAPQLSGKVLGDAESAIAALQAAPPAPAAVAVPDDFRGDTANLVRNIIALLELDAEGALVPHGVGVHARGLLSAAAARLAAAPAHECGNCFEGKSDLDHTCRKCSGSGIAPAQAVAVPDGFGTAEHWKEKAQYWADVAHRLRGEALRGEPVDGIVHPAQEHATQLAGNWKEQGYVSAAHYAEDMQAVGEALMEAIEDNYASLQAAGWERPMDSPAEIVVDLLNLLDEAKAAPAQAQEDAREAERLQIVLFSMVDQLEGKTRPTSGNAPYHGHSTPGVWDSDNGAKAGTKCAWCELWAKAVAMRDAARAAQGGAA